MFMYTLPISIFSSFLCIDLNFHVVAFPLSLKKFSFFLAFLLMEVCWPQVLSGIFILSSIVKDIFKDSNTRVKVYIFYLAEDVVCYLASISSEKALNVIHFFVPWCEMCPFCSPCLYIWIFW